MTQSAAVTTGARPQARPAVDVAMRRLLCIPDAAAPADESTTHRIFSASILVSATRCVLTYVIFPVVTPLLGVAAGVGPAIGIAIGLLALYFDVLGIRRFWLADHRMRWPITGLYVAVMVLVAYLVVHDIARLLH